MRLAAPMFPVLAALGGGSVLFATGVWIATASLPAWSLGELPDRGDLETRLRGRAREAGLTLLEDNPSWDLADRRSFHDPRAGSGSGGAVPEPEVLVRGGLEARTPDRVRVYLEMGYSPTAEAEAFLSVPLDPGAVLSGMALSTTAVEEARDLARLLVPRDADRGLELGEPVTLGGDLGFATILFPLGGEPVRHVEVIDPVGGALLGFLRPGPVEDREDAGAVRDLSTVLARRLPGMIAFLGLAGLFLVFLARRRIDLIHGAWLGGATFLVLLLASLPWRAGLIEGAGSLVRAAIPALWVGLLWSTAESWLRSLEGEFSTSLDALRLGRLGPRAGRGLLGGLGVGAAMAGAELLLLSGAGVLPAVSRGGFGVRLPVFGPESTPFTQGLMVAASLLMILVLALRFLPRRGAVPVAVLVAGWALRPVAVGPSPAAWAAGAVVAAGLAWAFRRWELTGLLAAGLTFHTLPAAILSLRLLDWMAGSFTLTAGLLLGMTTLGVAGLRREEEPEARGMGAPAFLRRLEEEKRLRHEMGLLERMQLGLLPEEVPRLEGWQISARSVLASEVGGDLYDFLVDDRGRLWIAAGDVSGHGYSCAIVHAMTKAALASLVSPERTPGEVLDRVDRVLRSVRYKRAFTSLALLRLDPATGEGRLANAGHPYPLLSGRHGVRDLELPGLPLGQGPPRSYRDLPLRLERGEVLVFCSDGLFEATDREVRAYGFDRPAELLAKVTRWPSNEILEMLLADWRRHRGSVEAKDDTTVVVVKRLAVDDEVTR